MAITIWNMAQTMASSIYPRTDADRPGDQRNAAHNRAKGIRTEHGEDDHGQHQDASREPADEPDPASPAGRLAATLARHAPG